MITLMGDPYGTVTSALGLQLTHAGPVGVGLVGRAKRCAMFLDDGVVEYMSIAEGPGPSRTFLRV